MDIFIKFRYMEKILCAAIWYKSLPTQELYAPNNIDRGLVLCGWRHGCIIQQLKVLANLRTCTFASDASGESVQGFLTSKNRFIDRIEAHALFVKNGGKPDFSDELYSEDLY